MIGVAGHAVTRDLGIDTCAAGNGRIMSTPSLETKKAYCAKTRKSNYAASLRLEGFDSSPSDIERARPTREQLLKTYRTQKA